MELVEKQVFGDEEVQVDGRQFKNCRFEGTTLHYTGGALPAFINCQFNAVSLGFGGAADHTLTFLRGLRKGGFAPAIDKIVKGIRDQQY
ncbi:MAG: hypothetical protein HC915_10220 [Anaerolineae bacterium]|nr:hypothetical protein [Anaerolineae bacterium]